MNILEAREAMKKGKAVKQLNERFIHFYRVPGNSLPDHRMINCFWLENFPKYFLDNTFTGFWEDEELDASDWEVYEIPND